MFYCKFVAYFQNTSKNTSRRLPLHHHLFQWSVRKSEIVARKIWSIIYFFRWICLHDSNWILLRSLFLAYNLGNVFSKEWASAICTHVHDSLFTSESFFSFSISVSRISGEELSCISYLISVFFFKRYIVWLSSNSVLCNLKHDTINVQNKLREFNCISWFSIANV